MITICMARRTLRKGGLMSKESLFPDTAFVLALLNRRDQYHAKAKALSDRLRAASEIWLTEAVLTEIGNGYIELV